MPSIRLYRATMARLLGLACTLMLATTPTWATDGRTAVGMCIDSTASGARCGWSVNNKGEIDICNKTGCVYCPSATAECVVAKKRPPPKLSLPKGVTVNTSLGAYEIGKSPGIDTLIKPRRK